MGNELYIEGCMFQYLGNNYTVIAKPQPLHRGSIYGSNSYDWFSLFNSILTSAGVEVEDNRYEYPIVHNRVCSKIENLWTNLFSREQILPHFHPSPKK